MQESQRQTGIMTGRNLLRKKKIQTHTQAL